LSFASEAGGRGTPSAWG